MADTKMTQKITTILLDITSTVMEFLRWDKLSTEEKVALITNTVSMALKAFPGVELTTNEAAARAVQAAEGDVEVMTKKWGKVFENVKKVYVVIASAAVCALLGFHIYNNLKTEASVPIKVLNIIKGASFAIVTLTSAIGLFVKNERLPVIGQVASIVAIVAMVLLMHQQRNG